MTFIHFQKYEFHTFSLKKKNNTEEFHAFINIFSWKKNYACLLSKFIHPFYAFICI